MATPETGVLGAATSDSVLAILLRINCALSVRTEEDSEGRRAIFNVPALIFEALVASMVEFGGSPRFARAVLGDARSERLLAVFRNADDGCCAAVFNPRFVRACATFATSLRLFAGSRPFDEEICVHVFAAVQK